jgi:hypothetical protein
MAASIGGSGTRTGRAASVRHEDEVMPGGVGATILIAGPGCWSSPERAIAMIMMCGFQVVISPGLSRIIGNSLIEEAIWPVALPLKTVTKLQDMVESDPEIVLTVDADRGELRARGALLARFELALREARPAGETNSRARGGETMARRLLMAQRLLGSASLPGEVRMRFQRRLVAICDAMKAPGADAGRGARRLDRLLIELARTGQPGLAQARDGRAPGPARDLGRRSGLDGGRRAP